VSSGHASHKGASVKPNTNTNDRIDDAAQTNLDPTTILPDEFSRADEDTPERPEALERGRSSSQT